MILIVQRDYVHYQLYLNLFQQSVELTLIKLPAFPLNFHDELNVPSFCRVDHVEKRE